MTPIVDLDPTPEPFRYKKGSCQWILWPFWAFKVTVPLPSTRRFNVLERFVLKASAAGARSTGRIAGALELEQELVEFIVDDLEERQFLDMELLLTEEGEKALRDDEEREPELTSGYVFSDPVSGHLWPRFISGSLSHCDAELSPDKRAKIKFGSVGNPYTQRAFTVWPGKLRDVRRTPPSPPDTFSIGDACRRYLREQKNWERFTGDDSFSELPFGDLSSFDFDPTGARLIDSEPLPYFLLTHVHMPENLGESSMWQVCDPFGLGLSRRLRKTMQDLIDNGDNLLRKNVIERAIGGTYEVNDAELSELLMARYDQAAKRLDNHFATRQLPDELLQKLTQMGHAFDEAIEALDGSGRQVDNADRDIRSFLRNAMASLEELFAEIVADYPVEREDKQHPPLLSSLGNSSKATRNLLVSLANQLDFNIDDSNEAALAVSYNRAKGVIEYGNRDLITAFAILILVASHRIDHPMHTLAAEFPGVFSLLVELRKLRGAANHANDHGTDPGRKLSSEELEKLRDDVLRVVKALIPPLEEAADVTNLDAPEVQWNAELMCKLRAAAAYDLRRRLGRSLNDSPVLKGRLVETIQFKQEIELLSRTLDSEGELGALTKKLQDLVFSGTVAYEASARHLVNKLPACEPPDELSDEKQNNLKYLIDLAQRFGFDFDAESEHAESLLKVNPKRLFDALESGDSSLNSLVWTALIRADVAGGEAWKLIQELAVSEPKFLQSVARLSWLRGHGNKNRLPQQEATDFAETTFQHAKKVLDICQ